MDAIFGNEKSRGQHLTLITALLIFLLIPWGCGAEPYGTGGSFVIESEYSGEPARAFKEKAFWTVELKPGESGCSIRFSLNPSGKFCSLDVARSTDSETVFTLYGPGNKVIDRTEGLFLPFAGIPPPCSVVDFAGFEKPFEVKLTRKAGNLKFTKIFNVEFIDVLPEEAERNGWIEKGRFKENEKELVILRMKNNKNEQVLFQLWEKNSAWWLFEQTGNIRSWRRE